MNNQAPGLPDAGAPMAPARAMGVTSLLFCAVNAAAWLLPMAVPKADSQDALGPICAHPVMVTQAKRSWLSCGPDAPPGPAQQQKAAPGDAWLWTDAGWALLADGMSGPARLALGLPLVLNEASVSELAHVPGLGPALGRRVVRYRQEHGRFSAPAELLQVPGLGPARAAAAQRCLVVRGP